MAFLGHVADADVTTNFAIVVDDVAVGGIGYIRGSDVERFSAEVGYWLGEAYWGRGLMTDAVTRLTQHLFEDVKLLRAFALPLADNQGSIRVLEKAGYEREALLRASCVKYRSAAGSVSLRPPQSLRGRWGMPGTRDSELGIEGSGIRVQTCMGSAFRFRMTAERNRAAASRAARYS